MWNVFCASLNRHKANELMIYKHGIKMWQKLKSRRQEFIQKDTFLSAQSKLVFAVFAFRRAVLYLAPAGTLMRKCLVSCVRIHIGSWRKCLFFQHCISVTRETRSEPPDVLGGRKLCGGQRGKKWDVSVRRRGTIGHFSHTSGGVKSKVCVVGRRSPQIPLKLWIWASSLPLAINPKGHGRA